MNSKRLAYLTKTGTIETATYGSAINGLFESGISDLDLTLIVKSKDCALNHKDFLRDVGQILQ